VSFAYTPITLTGNSSGGSSSSVGGGLVTVGESGNYPTISAAIEASHNVLFVNSLSTETQNINVSSSGLFVTILPGGTVDIGNFKFAMDNAILNINGNGILRYNHTSQNTLFDGNINSRLKVADINVDNDSVVVSYVTDINYAKFSDITFDGNVNILGNANIFSDCVFINGNLGIADSVSNTLIAGCIFDGILILDSGNGTVISDGVVV
jgi:hypothetical protein